MDTGNLFLISTGSNVSIDDNQLLEEISKKEMHVIDDYCGQSEDSFKGNFLFSSALKISDCGIGFNYDQEDIDALSDIIDGCNGDFFSVKTYSLYKNTSLVSIVLSWFLRGKSIDSGNVGMLDLCVTEIFNNVVEHAYKKESKDPIVLICGYCLGEISIAIFDKAKKTTQKIMLDSSGKNVPEENDSGRGVGIVQIVMDTCSVYYKHNRNTFLMKKKFEVLGCA